MKPGLVCVTDGDDVQRAEVNGPVARHPDDVRSIRILRNRREVIGVVSREGRRVGDCQGEGLATRQRDNPVREGLARVDINILRDHSPLPASHRHGEYEVAACRCERRRGTERGRCRVIGVRNDGTAVERHARHCRKLGGKFGACPCAVLQADFIDPTVPGVLSHTVTEANGLVAKAERHIVI